MSDANGTQVYPMREPPTPINKRDGGAPITEEWVRQQCDLFEKVLAGFSEEMRRRFEQRAREGRERWLKPDAAPRLHEDLIAHVIGIKNLEGSEADVANFALFLWRLRLERDGLLQPEGVPAAPAPVAGGAAVKVPT